MQLRALVGVAQDATGKKGPAPPVLAGDGQTKGAKRRAKKREAAGEAPAAAKRPRVAEPEVVEDPAQQAVQAARKGSREGAADPRQLRGGSGGPVWQSREGASESRS